MQLKLDTLTTDLNKLKKGHTTLNTEVTKVSETVNEEINDELADLKEQVKLLNDRLNAVSEEKTKEHDDAVTAYIIPIKKAFKEHKKATLTAIATIKNTQLEEKDDDEEEDGQQIDKRLVNLIENLSKTVWAMNMSMSGLYQKSATLDEDVDDIRKKVKTQLAECCTAAVDGDYFGGMYAYNGLLMLNDSVCYSKRNIAYVRNV